MTNKFLKTGITAFMPVALVLALLLFAPAAAFAEEDSGSDFHEENSSLAAETSFSSSDFLTSAITSFPDSTSSSGFDSSITPPPENETPVSDLSNPLPASDHPVLNGFEYLPEETPAEPCEPATSNNVNEGNSYKAEITPDAVVNGGTIPSEYTDLRAGESGDFTITFTELGDNVIAAAQVEIPAGFTNIGFSSDWTTVGIATSSAQQWEGRLDDVFIYLRALEEADYITKNEWVSVTFNAKTPTTNGAYSFETRAWTEDIPDEFGTDGFGAGFAEPAGTNNMAAGYRHPLVIVGTSVSTPSELAAVNPGTIHSFPGPICHYYVQTADIDLTGIDWTPIGTTVDSPPSNWTYFTGSYNGNGYKIIDLNIYKTGEVFVGLFRTTYHTANLLNINLENVDVTGGSTNTHSSFNIGALVGRNQGGYILNCTVSGVVTNVFYLDANDEAHGYDSIGGLVGLNTGSTAYIANCSSSATVNGYSYAGGLVGSMNNGAVVADSFSIGAVIGADIPSGSVYGIGGLVGHSSKEVWVPEETVNLITRSYATGYVTGVSEVGGLVGFASSCKITDSYATGKVTGTDRIGGLVGWNSDNSNIYRCYATGDTSGIGVAVGGLVGLHGSSSVSTIISDCYASGSVQASDIGGGLVGWNASQIINCYSTGAVTGSGSQMGGLVGYNYDADGATVTNSYYDQLTSGKTDTGKGEPRTTSQMLYIATYDSWSISTVTEFNPDDLKIWYINDSLDYPKLAWQYGNIITVKANDMSKVYGDNDPSFTATYDDTILEGTLILAREPGENVGSYAITPSGLTPPAGNEYLIHFVDGTLTITKLPITVTADTKTKVYGEADPAFTYTTLPTIGSALPNVEIVSLSGALSRVAGNDIGVYDINRGTLTDEANPNYAIIFNGAKLTINARPITVTANAQTKASGDPDPVLTYQITTGSLVYSDTFSGTLTREAGEDVSTYGILQGTLVLSSNYTLSYIGANFTITAKVEDPPSDEPPSSDPPPDNADDGFTEPSTSFTAQPTGLIFSSAGGGSPIISADLIISGTTADLAEAQALYQAMLEAFEQNMASMTEAEYAVAVIELAVARAAIMVMEARLSGDPAALATAIEAYQFAQQQLAVYGSYLGGEQSAVVESLMSAIDSVITALEG